MIRNRKSTGLVCVLALLMSGSVALSATWYVDDDAVASGDGTSWGTAFATIQAGIDAAVDGDTVLVSDGTYTGNGNRDISFNGKAITVVSKNGAAETIVDCTGPAYKGFWFHNNETSSSVLDGFTVTHSSSIAIHCNRCSPVIRNCLLQSNHGTGGSAMTIQSGSPQISSCHYYANSAYDVESCSGGAMKLDHTNAIFVNCIFARNRCETEWIGYNHSGGAVYIYGGSPSFINCTFNKNSAGMGGAIAAESRTSLVIRNSILWNNTSMLGYDAILISDNSTISVEYSCVQGGWTGTGNISVDPMLIPRQAYQPYHDYHNYITPGSPCIDAGNNGDVPAGFLVDFQGNARFVDDPDTNDTGLGTPPIVDMGAVEYQPAGMSYCGNDECSEDESICSCPYDCGEPPATETECTDGQDNDCDGLVDMGDPDCAVCGDGECTAGESCNTCASDCCYSGTIYVDDDAPNIGDGMSWATAFQTIQEGIDIAGDGAEVVVADGTYSDSITLEDRGITVRSVNGPTTTFIDGQGSFFPIICSDADGSVFDGFSFQNVYMVTTYNAFFECNESDMEIRNCRFTNFFSNGESYSYVLMVSSSNARITQCIFDDIDVDAVYVGGQTVEIDQCTFQNIGLTGLEISRCSSTVTNCVFQNITNYYSLICRGYDDNVTTFIANCLFANNTRNPYNGPSSDLTLINSTFYNNTLRNGATATVANCVFWGDDGVSSIDNEEEAEVTVSYSCVDYAGTGNIEKDPMFLDPANQDFRLDPASLVVDMGDNSAVPAWLVGDLQGNRRIANLVVDMGAYEVPSPDGDWDVDGDVDLADFAGFQECYGSGEPLCQGVFDLDSDGDVDLDDFEAFAGLMTGPQ